MKELRLPDSVLLAVLIFVLQAIPAWSQSGASPPIPAMQTTQSPRQGGVFDLKPITTDNILTIVQIIVVAVSLLVADKSLTTNAQGLRASTLGSLFAAGRELALNSVDVQG